MDAEGSSISDYRSRLDKTLTSTDLTNEERVHSLVKRQILQTLDSDQEYTDFAVKRRSKEVFKLLNELRSASRNDSQTGWKVKQDTEEFRVMYREGPEGTPFHTLLAEGYVDGPVDVCLCISCDSDLYKKWWPQITVPTFRVTASHCVQKVIVGEQISIVRMKLSWPLSGREALVHYFVFEYFQDGLVVVLLESISDAEAIDRSTHGYSPDGIPDADDVVRMDLYGGFALKKVTADRSFFRTIANLDIKLDFVPPSLINFVARQLVGSGFKLYKKEVASAKSNVKFQEALRDPLYTRVREALYADNTSMALEKERSEAFTDIAGSEAMDGADAHDRKTLHEIEEFEERGSDRSSEGLDEGRQELHEITEEVRAEVRRSHEAMEHLTYDVKTEVSISLEVVRALGTLEKAISMLREYHSSPGKNRDLLSLEDDSVMESSRGEADEVKNKDQANEESSKLVVQTARISSDHHGSRLSNSSMRVTNQSKIEPDEDGTSPSHTNHIDPLSSLNQSTTRNSLLNGEANNGKGSSKKLRLCCLAFNSREME